MKKHKTLIISLIVIASLIIGIWWYSKKSTDATLSSFESVATKIAAKMEDIKANSEWMTNINNSHAAQNFTVNQSIAANAIWALKHDGEIPVDTYGAGEWGHMDYVRANY